MSDTPIPTAILGASGYIGQHFSRLLSAHPRFGAPQLLGGERSRGQALGDVWLLPEAAPPELETVRLRSETPAALARSGVRIVFSALPSGTAGPFEKELVRRGVSVFSNASDHRLEPGAALLVPEVNGDHLALASPPRGGRGLLVTNPNCATTGLVLGLAPLVPLLRPRTVHVTTFQSISGAGYPGVPSLAISDNVIPFIREEEEKVERETARLLGHRRSRAVVPWPPRVVAHCARVATREGHLEAVTVETAARPTRSTIEAAWTRFDPLADLDLPTAPHPPVELRAAVDRPQPLRDRWAGHPTRARGMAAVVGRVRWDPPFLRFFILSHNAVRGGAGGSVLNAEYALARNAIPLRSR
ncbi:MAG: aspartate-semialdehyde dehydrogenase [Thermoplasmata archaeon]